MDSYEVICKKCNEAALKIFIGNYGRLKRFDDVF